MNHILLKELDNRVEEGNSLFMSNFLKENNLDDFIKEEERWIKNNLDYIYSCQDENVVLKINPYYKLVQYNVKDGKEEINAEYILVPKYLANKSLYIHAGLLEKADLLIKVLINTGGSFELYEIREKIIKNNTPNRKEELQFRLYTMINKFLSYQYLIIE